MGRFFFSKSAAFARFLALLLLASLIVFFNGCAGYHIGPIQPTPMRGVKTIAVGTFKNATLIPRIEVLITDTVIRQIQQDGTYQIAPEDKADAVLTGEIERVRRSPSRSVVGNVIATAEFTMDLTIHYTVRRRDNGLVVQNTSATGQTNFFVSGDVNQDERQAIPLAAQDAAVRLVSQISEGW